MSSSERRIREQIIDSKLVNDPPLGSVYNEPAVPPLTMNVPDTGYPPKKYEPYLSEPYPPLSLNYSPIPQDDQHNRNYVATGSKLESQPSMHNEEGWAQDHLAPLTTQGLSPEHNSIIFEPPMINETIRLDLDNNYTIQESIGQIRHEFDWLSDDYLDRVKKVNADGKWYLIRASAETITDHRSEGEKYRRKLDGDELHAMARTAINHGMDINHLGKKFKTGALIADAEYDKKRKEIQMLVHETDPTIIDAVQKGDVDAVSINGGAPRDTRVECPENECFNVPRGVVLGELDGIALTWVVTNPNGITWKNKHIPRAKPGVGVTKIQPL